MIEITNWVRITDRSVWVDGIQRYEWGKEGVDWTILYQLLQINYSKFHKMDKLAKAAFLGTELLLEKQVSLKKLPDDVVGLLFANSEGSATADIRFQESYVIEKLPSPAQFVYTLPNIALGELAIRNKWYGENMFSIFPNFVSSYYSQFAALYMTQGMQSVIGGWVDVHKQTDVLIFVMAAKPGDTDQEMLDQQLELLYGFPKQ